MKASDVAGTAHTHYDSVITMERIILWLLNVLTVLNFNKQRIGMPSIVACKCRSSF